MKKIMLLITLFLLLFNSNTGFSQNSETSITSNFPKGISGTIAVSSRLQASSRPNQTQRQSLWQFHNPKIGSLLNQKINRSLAKFDQRLKISSNPDQTDPESQLSETICVQIKCATNSQTTPEQATADRIRKKIEEAGGRVTGSNRNHTTIQALIPITAANLLANLPEVNLIHLPSPAITFGNFTTEALDDINADNWHDAGIYGQNTKIGIIDVGFIGYNSLKGIDLPTTITAKNFVDGESDSQLESYSEHGTACAEIVYDVAPDAAMYLAKIYTNIDLQEAANWMQANHVDIITTSLGFYNLTPGDGTGGLAETVAQANSAGILWVTAAGNDRRRHWGGLFSDPDGNGMLNFNSSGQEINFFGPGDGTAYLINPGLKYSVFARWSDWDNPDQDYDIYIYRWNGSNWGSPIASSVNPQDGSPGQIPTEVAEFTTSGDPTPYGFIIYHSFAVNKEVNFEIFVPYAPRLDEILTNRSLANLADAPRATTVSAMDVDSYVVQSYSSMGPTNGPGGIIAGGLNKPDITSYTNVSTNSYGPRGFSGTSAATPHVAGTAALILSQNPTFSPAQLQTSLKTQALDIGAAGYDFATGWGRLHLDTISPSDDLIWEGYSIYWNNSTNWSGNTIPDSNDDVIIPGIPTGGNHPLISGINTRAGKLTLSGNLTISSGTLTIGN